MVYLFIFQRVICPSLSTSPSHETLLLSSVILSLRLLLYFPQLLSHELNQSTFSYFPFFIITSVSNYEFSLNMDFFR